MKKVRVLQPPPPITELLELLQNLSTKPFRDELAKTLNAAPPREVIRRFAAKKPGEWALMVKTLAGLAGYSEKTVVEHEGILGHIHAMSDAELFERARTLALKNEKVIDTSPDLVEDFSK